MAKRRARYGNTQTNIGAYHYSTIQKQGAFDRQNFLSKRLDIGVGPFGNNAGGIYLRVRPVVMRLNLSRAELKAYNKQRLRTYMFKVRRVLESRNVPIQVLHPAINFGVVVSNGAEVALEMTVVNRVESDNCSIQTDIGLGQTVSDEVVLPFDQLLKAVQRLEQRSDGSLVRFLRSGKPRLIHTI